MKHAPLLLAVLAALPDPLVAEPRPPLPPWPEEALVRWQFDDPYQQRGADGRFPVLLDPFRAESWSGYSLLRRDLFVEPVSLPMLAPGAVPYLAPAEGTIRFWFSPDWSSGRGPGADARLLGMTTHNDKASLGWWELEVTADGRALLMRAHGDAGSGEVLRAPLDWEAGGWHLIALEYSPDWTALHLDGELAAIGDGLMPIPGQAQGFTSLFIGSDESGTSSARGQFDELATFDYAYPEDWLAWYYRAMRPTADLGPIISREAERERLLAQSALLPIEEPITGGQDGGGFTLMGSGFWLQNPVVTPTTVTLQLAEADPLRSYEIYFAPVLSVPWVLATSGTMGQINFSLPRGMYNIGFYRAAEGSDWDGDGVPNYRDARPSDASIGLMIITIESPANGSTIN
jgi:hypothetical protein